MSLQARITALAQAIAADVKTMSAALSGKASASHGHAIADVTGLQDALDSLSGGGGSGGVPEAPTDGGTYARRNGAWVSALATDSDPAADLLGYFLGAPDGAVLEGMLGSLFWRIGWFDLLSSPASLASIFADSAAMVAICTSPGSRGGLAQGEGESVKNGKFPHVAAALMLAGCAATTRVEIQRVNVPVPVECREPVPERPVMPTDGLASTATLDQFAQAAMAEIERREGYEGELRFALENCRKPIGGIREQ